MHNATRRIGLCLDGIAGDGLYNLLGSAGYDVFRVSDPHLVQMMAQTNQLDAWVFDARDEGLFDILSPTGRYLLPADNVPSPDAGAAFDTWCSGILKQVDCAVGDATAQPGVAMGERWPDVQSVWVLGGSSGALAAVEEFLCSFSAPPPAAIILAIHFNPALEGVLSELDHLAPHFSIKLARGRQYLGPGDVLVVPARCRLVFGGMGEVIASRSEWNSEYTPCINEVLASVAAANMPSPGAIIFSGMGVDGSEGVRVLQASGGTIWAQDPEQSVVHSMPAAAIATGMVSRVGSPAELALAFEGVLTGVYRSIQSR